jgi:hypothetical protein
LTFILLPPGRGNGGEHPLPMLWMPFMASRCHVLGPQHGPWPQQQSAGKMSTGTTRISIWDRPVRLFHWTLMALVATSYASGKGGAWTLHYASGYAILTLVLRQ